MQPLLEAAVQLQVKKCFRYFRKVSAYYKINFVKVEVKIRRVEEHNFKR